jgi:hypothetical protein
LLLVPLFWAPTSQAEVILFQVEQPDLSTAPGGTVTFHGTITNESLIDLQASDFFFIFFGVDPAAVTLTQDVGVTIDFPIPNGTTSPSVPLFDATLAPGVPEGTFLPIQVVLENNLGHVSPPETVTVTASGPMESVPEPNGLMLVGAGLSALASRMRKIGRSLKTKTRCRL